MKGHLFIIYFLLTLGPVLPYYNFNVVEIQGDAFIFGGTSIYQLTCTSGICSWSTLNQELKISRYEIVAIPVTDTFCV